MRRRVKKNKSKLFLPIFIISILVLSIFGVMIGGITQENDFVKYRDIYFTTEHGAYFYNLNGIQFRLLNNPLDIEGFFSDFPIEFLDESGYSKVYLDVSDDDSLSSVNNLYANMGRVSDFSYSCNEESADKEQCTDKPLRTCDSHSENLIVKFTLDEENKIDYSDKCLFVKGNNGYLNGISDNLVMIYSGVYNE